LKSSCFYKKVAEFIGKQKKTFIYRIHDEPNEDKFCSHVIKFVIKLISNKGDISKEPLMEDVNGKKEQTY
jgi:ribonuclease R